MGCNDPQHKEQFLTWLKARIEEGGDSIKKPPSELLAAYRSGNPKDLDASMWREWYDHFNPGWKEEAVAVGGFTTPLSSHPENRVRFLAWLATKVKDWGYEMHTAPYGMREAFESGSPEKLDASVFHMWEDEFYGRTTDAQLEPGVKHGPRGGRYTEDVTREGRPYRRYF